MFRKADFFIRTILLWALLTITLMESGRQKKDVHHMIFLNESKRPSRNYRHKEYEHQDYYKEYRPNKSRKKPVKKDHNESPVWEDTNEGSSHEEFLRHQPKHKRHQHGHNNHPSRNQKRQHNHDRHQNHKKHHKNDHYNHNNHGNHKSNYTNLFPPENWIPMTSKELFGSKGKQSSRESGLGLGPHSQGFIQSIPMEITTPLPLQSISAYNLQSTLYPPLSLLSNRKLKNRPQQPFIGTVESYKPFDYSILEHTPQNDNPASTYEGQKISASNSLTGNNNSGKDVNPLSIIVENSREILKDREKPEGKQEKKREEDGHKVEKAKEKGKRGRGSSRYRMRSKN